MISKREKGKSKFTIQKQIRLAADGITSFSTRPINCILIAVFPMSVSTDSSLGIAQRMRVTRRKSFCRRSIQFVLIKYFPKHSSRRNFARIFAKRESICPVITKKSLPWANGRRKGVILNSIFLNMRLVIQRVKNASVSIGGEEISSIGAGLLVLVGVENGDTEEDMRWLSGICRSPSSTTARSPS